MNFLNENASVGSLVKDSPEYARVFEKLGLDYCCKGKSTLKEACDAERLDVDEVIEALRLVPAFNALFDWDQMTIEEVADYIVETYHNYLRQELPRITQLVEKVNMKHGQRHPYIADLKNAFEKMRNSLFAHMEEEERVVFPLMIALTISKESHQEEVKKHLDSLDKDHLEIKEGLERIKELTNGYNPPINACITHIVMLNSLKQLDQNLHEHIHKENQILFPRAKAMI